MGEQEAVVLFHVADLAKPFIALAFNSSLEAFS